MNRGKLEFAYLQLFVRHNNDVRYSGKWADRSHLPKALEDLQDIKEVPTNDRGPKIDPAWAAAAVDLTWSAVYVKKPALLAYISSYLETQIAREIETCGILRKHSHPNIATYYG